MTPLSRYRRFGADPPFGDPRRAHGTRFEGYYWRLTDVARGRVAIVLCGISRDALGAWAVVALASHPDGLVRSALIPAASVSFHDLAVRAGAALTASAEGLRVDLGEGARLELRFEGRREWEGVFGGIGPAQVVPGLPQYWHPHLLGGRVVGSGWDGAVVYAEKNWGPRFTEHWWWGQATGFAGADACAAFAGGRVLGGAPTSVVVRLEDRVVRLAPPFAALTTAVGEAGWRIRARSPRWTVELEGSASGSPVVLPVPVPEERRVVDRSQQYLAGSLRVRVSRGRRGSCGRGTWLGRRSPDSSAGSRARKRTPRSYPARRSPAPSARRTATANGSAPTSRSNGPITVHSAFNRARATPSTGSTRASLTSVEQPSSPRSAQCANNTRTVPRPSQERNASGPSSRG